MLDLRKITTLLIISVILLSGLCGYLIITSLEYKGILVKTDAKNKRQFDRKIERERKLIRKDLEEKYAADIVSYNAMAKRLEAEKKKAKDLEEKMKSQEQGEGKQ